MSTPIDPTGSGKIVTPPRVSAVKPASSSTSSNSNSESVGSNSSSSSSNNSSNDDTVHLTGNAVQIHQLAATVAKTPAFDAKKVSDLKQAISGGKYTVDSKATAGKMLALDSGLGAY